MAITHHALGTWFTTCAKSTQGKVTTQDAAKVTCRECLSRLGLLGQRQADLDAVMLETPKQAKEASKAERNIKAYSIVQIRRVLAELETWRDTSQDALDNAENADSPNEARIGALQTRIDALEAAIEALEGIE